MLLPAPSSKPAESPFAKHQNQNAFTIAVYKFERTEAVKARGPTLSVQEICQLNALILPSFSTYWKEMERVTAHRYAPDIERKLLLTVWNDCTLRASAHVEDWGTMKRKWEAEMQKFIVIEALLLTAPKLTCLYSSIPTYGELSGMLPLMIMPGAWASLQNTNW